MNIRGILILFLICISLACEKEEVDVNEHNLLKVVQLDEDYFARNSKELSDGSILIVCMAKADPYSTEFGKLPSYLIKFSKAGELIWKKSLPEIVHVVNDFLILKNGNFLITGFDDIPLSDNLGFLLLDNKGDVINQRTYHNQTSFASSSRAISSFNAVELSNGSIAVAAGVMTSWTIYFNFCRLIVLDQSLNIVTDKTYTPDPVVLYIGVDQLSVSVDQSDNLFIGGVIKMPWSSSNPVKGFVMKLTSPDFNPEYFEAYTNKKPRVPSNIAIAADNEILWATCGTAVTDSIPHFNFNFQETYTIGPEITVYKSNGDTTLRKKVTITGYPKYGYVSKIIACKDGGFALLGTCNINVNQDVPSEYRLLMIKLDRNLQPVWMRFPDTYAPTIAASIEEVDNAFLISATHYSLRNKNQPVFFKISHNGLIQ